MTNYIDLANLTDLEQTVLVIAQIQCHADYCSSVKDIARVTGLEIASVKGAVGSLVKKGKLLAESEERNGKMFMDIFVVTDEGILSHGQVV